MDWRGRLAGYLRQRLPAADDIAIVRVGGMPAGASNQTLSIDIRVVCDGVVADLPLVLRPERPDGILAPYDVGRQFQVLRATPERMCRCRRWRGTNQTPRCSERRSS